MDGHLISEPSGATTYAPSAPVTRPVLPTLEQPPGLVGQRAAHPPAGVGGSSYAERLRDLLVSRSPTRLNMAAAARILGLSVRSLRKRLTAEGTAFREVEYQALATVARRLLQQEQRTVQETAWAMGFAEATAFHRAFKRWTGTTPSTFRRPAGAAPQRRPDAGYEAMGVDASSMSESASVELSPA